MTGHGEVEMPLRGRPRYVKESSYAARDSARRGLFGSFYTRYGFDTTGNLVSVYDYRNDKICAKTDYWIDQNGLQISGIDEMKKEHLLVSRRLADGRYQLVFGIPGEGPVTWLVSYLAGGDEVIEETFNDSMRLDSPVRIHHSFVHGNRPIKFVEHTPTSSIEARYFCSTFDRPDSILSDSGTSPDKKWVERQFLVRNQYGDVEKEIVIAGCDTTLVRRSAYIYDEKSNWIRRISTRLVDKNTREREDSVVISDREFVY